MKQAAEQNRQRRAVVREYCDALDDGDIALALRIKAANRDVFTPGSPTADDTTTREHRRSVVARLRELFKL